jgi:ubiquinone/menaquinone biosynthesis C-methylase UbiE
MGDGGDVGAGFDRTAPEYDELLARNRMGARRLVEALPPGPFPDVLDVGCGTGFLSEEMVRARGARRIVGVDPSEGMLERFRAKLADLPVEATLVRAGVHDMDVPDAAFDAVVSGMAFHWFPDKPGAVRAMARRVRPGGVLGIVAAGTGTDRELLDVMQAITPPVPRSWIEIYDQIHRNGDELQGYLEDAGLEALDVWEERRTRVTSPEAFLQRIQAVAGHLSAELDPDEAAAHGERVTQGVIDASGPEGFRYSFIKLYGVARRPG